MSTKTIKAGLSKANVNAIAGAIGTATLNRLVPQFSTSVAYTKGQYTNYNNQLYRFTADKSAGAWDSTKVESATLNDLINDVNGAVSSVVGKANTQDLLNGTLVPAKALTAEQIENVGEDVGSTQNAPFIFQATATDNGADSVETAPVAKHLRKLGNSVVANQLAKEFNTTIWTFNAGVTGNSITNGVVTFTANAQYGSVYTTSGNGVAIANGHKYLLSIIAKTSKTGGQIRLSNAFYLNIPNTNNSFQQVSGIVTANVSQGYAIYIQDNNASDWVEMSFKNFILIDLTQWFGSNTAIPQDLLDHPENAGRYGMLGLSYNTGTLTNNNGRYLKCVGRNQFDGLVEKGGYDSTGKFTDNDRTRLTNLIRVISGVKYYYRANTTAFSFLNFVFYDNQNNQVASITKNNNSSFDVPSNACWLGIFTGPIGSSLADFSSVVISLYYEDGTGYSDYYPYEENTYDTGTEVLLAFDKKYPSGLIERNTGEIIFTGQETGWSYNSDGYFIIYKADIATKAEEQVNFITSNGIVCKRVGSYFFVSTTANPQLNSSTDMNTIFSNGTKVQYLYNNAYKTTEQGTPFPENIEVDNYGSMGWLDTDSAYVDIPQGSEFFYPADYVEFIDSLYTRSKDGGDSADVSNIVVKSELQSVQNTINTRIPALPSDSENGTYTLKATMSDGTITYAWVAD